MSKVETKNFSNFLAKTTHSSSKHLLKLSARAKAAEVPILKPDTLPDPAMKTKKPKPSQMDKIANALEEALSNV